MQPYNPSNGYTFREIREYVEKTVAFLRLLQHNTHYTQELKKNRPNVHLKSKERKHSTYAQWNSIQQRKH